MGVTLRTWESIHANRRAKEAREFPAIMMRVWWMVNVSMAHINYSTQYIRRYIILRAAACTTHSKWCWGSSNSPDEEPTRSSSLLEIGTGRTKPASIKSWSMEALSTFRSILDLQFGYHCHLLADAQTLSIHQESWSISSPIGGRDNLSSDQHAGAGRA